MILTDKEMDQVRRALELQAGLDEELMRRCGHLIHLGAFDEAVRSAFVLLEERLRQSVGQERMTGTQLANFAFSPSKGPLSRQLGHSPSEKEGLRELYSGAFKLFRNPTAHGVVEYSAAEGKAIIGLVDLLLRLLKRAEELPPPGLLPENLEIALAKVEEAIGPGASSRLHNFLGKCVSELGLVKSRKVIPPYCLVKSYRSITETTAICRFVLRNLRVMRSKTCFVTIAAFRSPLRFPKSPSGRRRVHESGRFRLQTGTTL